MINEERLCSGCQLPINDMRQAVTIPDEGVNQVWHRQCLERFVGEEPTPDEPVAKGVWAGQRPLVHIRGAVAYEGGKPVFEHDLMQKADEPIFSPDQCVLCKRALSGDQDVVRSGSHAAHQACVRVLLEFVNQPDTPTRPTTPVTKAVPSKQVVLTENEERIGRRDALYLVQALANMLKESGV